MKVDNRGSLGLIALLVTVLIIVVAAAIYFGGRGGVGPMTVKKDSALLDSKSTKQTVVGQAIDTGKAADCRERLNQIRTGITSFKATGTDDRSPATLKDVGLGVRPDYFQCPVSGKPYTYDAATGTVKCPTHNQF
jgi:hypothetical protein